ncbi:hypothetical protein PPSIR1_20889, partial [Plesiocystis pacifica SIR-1]
RGEWTEGGEVVPPKGGRGVAKVRRAVFNLCFRAGEASRGRLLQPIARGMFWRPSHLEGVIEDAVHRDNYLILGGPMAITCLADAVTNILDLVYACIHGNYALALSDWLEHLSVRPFDARTYPPRLAMGMWIIAHGDELEARGRLTRARASEWHQLKRPQTLPSPPPWPTIPGSSRRAQGHGFKVNPFVAERLNILRELLTGQVPPRPKPDGTPKPAIEASPKTELAQPNFPVWLTAAAYERGGRKPPSVTHNTTYGVDLDMPIPNLPSAKGRNASEVWRTFELTMTALSEPRANAEPLAPLYEMIDQMRLSLARSQRVRPQDLDFPSYYSEPEVFAQVVSLLQGLLLTLPSRLYFADPLAALAAVGSVSDALGGPEHNDRVRVHALHYSLELTGHHNHVHVDWLSAEALDGDFTLAPRWARNPALWKTLTKNERRSIQGTLDNLERPYFIARRASTHAAGQALDIRALSSQLATQADGLKFPIGGVEGIRNTDNLLRWYRRYFRRRGRYGSVECQLPLTRPRDDEQSPDKGA